MWLKQYYSAALHDKPPIFKHCYAKSSNSLEREEKRFTVDVLKENRLLHQKIKTLEYQSVKTPPTPTADVLNLPKV